MEIWFGCVMFGGLLAILLIGVPIAFALLFVSAIGLLANGGGLDALDMVASTLWTSVTTFTLTSVPIFLLMGAIISASGMGARLYSALATIMNGIPGGLAVATTAACTVMAAVSGSSVATAAAIGGFAIHEMRRLGYRETDATGSVAAGGTLGILLPPSIPLIVYSIIAEQSIGKLFIASILPGLVMALAFAGYQVVLALYRRSHAEARPAAVKVTVAQRFAALRDVVPFAILIWIILGSLYMGLATPSEAAALGALASLGLSLFVYRDLKLARLPGILRDAARSCVMVLSVIAAAIVFGYVMTATQVAPAFSNAIGSAKLSTVALFIAINLLLILFGCFMEAISIIVVTMPILVPIVRAEHWDLIWFGVIVAINMEMALIHPPVGLNLFVVQSVAQDIPLRKIVFGTLPYVGIMAAVMALVALVPSLTTILLR